MLRMMRKTLPLLCLAWVMIGVIARADTPAAVPILPLASYQSADGTASISYPDGWFKKYASGSRISFLSKENPSAADPGDGISFESFDVPNGVSLATIVKTNKENLLKQYPDLQYSSDKPAMLGKHAGWKLEHDLQLPGVPAMHHAVIFAVVGRKAYFVTFVSPQANFNAAWPTFAAVAGSFKSGGSPAAAPVATVAHAAPAAPDGMKLFQSASGFSIAYPKTWVVDPSARGARFFAPGDSASVVSVEVESVNSDTPMPLVIERFRKSLIRGYPDAKLQADVDSTIGAFPAHTLELEMAGPGGLILRVRSVIARAEGRAVVISVTASQDAFNATSGFADEMTTTFALTPPAAAPVAPATAAAAAPALEMKTFQSDAGFSIAYPKTWVANPGKNGATFLKVTNKRAVVVSVEIHPLTASLPVVIEETKKKLLEKFPASTLRVDVDSTLGALPAHVLEYEAPGFQGQMMRIRNLIAKAGSKAIILTVAAPPELFDANSAAFDEMIRSFEMTP